MSGVNVEEIDDVFCDTSSLLSYILDQNAQGANKLVTEVGRPIVISESVKEELERVPDRREEIYLDFLEIILSDDKNIEEAVVENRDYLHPNDTGYIDTLREEIENQPPEKRLTVLREKQKIIDRRYGQTMEIVEHICEQNNDLGLILRLGTVINNEDDCQVVADAVGWVRNGGSGSFVTLDREDLLSNAEEINSTIEEYHDNDCILNIVTPEEIVEDWEKRR